MSEKSRTTSVWPVAVLICSIACCFGVRAAATLEPDRFYHHRIWQFEDGLPQNAVQAVIQTRNGYIWAGTAKGLARFNGIDFSVYDRKNAPELGDSSAYCFCETKEGSLWIGTESGGLNRLKDNHLEHYSTSDGLAGNSIRAIYETRDGTLWISTVQGVSTFSGGKFTRFTAPNWDGTRVVRSFCEEPSGKLWLGTSKGLQVLSNGVVQAAHDVRAQCRAVLRDRRGDLWAGTDNGLFRIKPDGQSIRYRTADGLSANIVSALFEDRRGNLWIGTYGGLNRFADGKIYTEITTQGTAYDQVNSICEDAQGNIWVGSKEGLNRVNSKRFITYTIQQGLSQNNTMAVIQDKKGALWTTIWGGGLNCLHEEKVTAYLPSELNHLKSDLLLALCEDHNGDLWIGADWDGGLYRFHGGEFTRYPCTAARVILEDRRQNLWIGTSTGLELFRDGVKVQFTTEEGLPANSVRDLEEDHEGNLWIGTSGGLCKKKDGAFKSFSQEDGLIHTNVLSLYEDKQHDLWIGTAGGLNRLRNGKFSSYNSANGLHADELLGILDDENGNLWISSRKGIFRIRIKDVEAFDQRKLAKISCVVYGKQDGMESVQCNGVAKPASWKSNDGRLWFTTTKGLVVIDPKTDSKASSAPPPIMIEDVLVDGKPTSPKNIWELGANHSTIRVPPGRSKLEFHYASLSYSNPEQNRFRYRLTGFEEQWTEPTTQRSAYYSNLRPGHYRFEVIGADCDGTWNSVGDHFDFYLQPYFYQTGWFYCGCGVSLCFLVLGGHRLRVRHLRRSQQELMALIDERTSNLQASNEQLRQEIADRRRAEEALRLSQETVVRQEKLAVVGQLAAGVAHEFNNILTVIQGHAALMLETKRDPEDIDSLESISAGACRAADLTRQMLAFSRQQIMRTQVLNLNDLIGRLSKTLAPLLTERVSLICQPAEGLPDICADPGMMEQILINLVVNARDAMPGGGKVTLSTGRIVVTPAELAQPGYKPHAEGAYPGEFVWVRLADNGNGMDPATLKRVFEPFFTTKDVGKGTGLGLATVYGVVRQHNGWINVESRVGQGTTFTVFLPLAHGGKPVQK